jgi:hypothetical protein
METASHSAPISRARFWTGWVLTVVPGAFLLLGGIMNLFKPPFVVQGTVESGYSENVIVPLGIVLTACTILYLVPRTCVLGAILLTGYLGGAVATHVMNGDGPIQMLFPVVFASLLWGGLVLRDRRLAALLF